MANVQFELIYLGNQADEHQLDFYDAAIALVGFQRSLAITTHLVLNNEVITQAPALKGAKILSAPPEPGSWKATAIVIAGLFSLGTASRETPIGHLISSAYDYVVSETLGFHVDFDSTLGEQYEQRRRAGTDDVPALTSSRFDSVIEKCEVAIRDMHRPIIKSETAHEAILTANAGGHIRRLAAPLTRQSYDHMLEVVERPNQCQFSGKISSYNVNTFRGRVFLGEAERPVPFELADIARNPQNVTAITRSLDGNARSRSEGEIRFVGFPLETKTGRLRSIIILDIES